MRVLHDADSQLELLDGVAETLSFLKTSGLKLGVVTNSMMPTGDKACLYTQKWLTNANQKRALIEAGLSVEWDGFVSSCEAGAKKPHPMPYMICLQQTGLEAACVAFIGHSASELEGAKRIGMITVACNADSDAVGDYSVASFSELGRMRSN